MDIIKLEIGDVTDELILQHYDIEVERKSKHKKTTQYIRIDNIGETDIFDFLAEVQSYYDKVIENLEIPNGYAIAEALLCPIQEYDDFYIDVRVLFSRLETDEEVLQRLFNRIRRDIKKYQKSLKSKESAEDKERKLYENLKKKYETNK